MTNTTVNEAMAEEEERVPGEDELLASWKTAITLAMAIIPDPGLRYAYDEQRGYTNVRKKAAAVESLRPRIEALAKFGEPVDLRVFQLLSVATAMFLAGRRVRRLQGIPEDSIKPKLSRLLDIREIVVHTLRGAAAAGQVHPTKVANIVKGTGYINFSMDVPDAIDLFDSVRAFDAHPTVTQALRAEGRQLALEVLGELKPVGAPVSPKELSAELDKATLERNQLYTLLLVLDAEADRLLRFFLGEAAAKEAGPALQAGKNAGRKTTKPAPASADEPAA